MNEIGASYDSPDAYDVGAVIQKKLCHGDRSHCRLTVFDNTSQERDLTKQLCDMKSSDFKRVISLVNDNLNLTKLLGAVGFVTFRMLLWFDNCLYISFTIDDETVSC